MDDFDSGLVLVPFYAQSNVFIIIYYLYIN
jgi:hypothetical protein